MTKGSTRDLAVMLGEPKRAIRSMIAAMIVAMAVMQINSFVDTFWIAGLGPEESSAVSTVSPMYFLMAAIGVGVGVGATTTIAFRLGRGETEDAEKLAGASLASGLILSVMAAVVLFLLYDVFIWIMGAEDIRDDGLSYMLPLFACAPAIVLDTVVGGMMRGEGAARKSTAVQMSAAIFNMVIDPILIYGLDMGIAGAGLSTGVSAFLALLIGFDWYRRGTMAVTLRASNLRPGRRYLREVLDVGGPRSVESMISSLSDILQRTFIIVAGGTNAVMFYNYAWRYIGLANLPAQATSSSMIPVSSAALGIRDVEKARTAYMYTLKLAVSCSAVGAAVMFVFADPLMSILTYEEDMAALRPEFAWTLMVGGLCAPLSAMMNVGSSMLQSMKKSKVSMYYYFLWMVLKLSMYAVACHYSFHALIWCMVIVHGIGGVCLLFLGKREFDRVRARAAEEAARLRERY